MILEKGTQIRDFVVRSHRYNDGWGDVYLAEDTILNRKVNLRCIHRNLTLDTTLPDRLFEEINREDVIHHPNVEKLYTLFSDKDAYYLISEYFDGTTLRTLLDTFGAIQEQRAMVIFSQIINALVETHKHGIEHFALNPRYIHVSDTDAVVISGFGYSQFLDKKMVQSGSPNDGLMYRAPEQLYGIENLDERTDLYACGIILYEMLTGKSPYLNGLKSEFLLMKEISEQPLPDPRLLKPELSLQTCQVLAKLGEKDREKRIKTFMECRQMLFTQESELNLRQLALQSTSDLFSKAKDLYQQRRLDEASTVFKFILEKEPESALAYFYLGQIELDRSHYQEAGEFLTKALVLQPWNDKVLYFTGLLNFKQGKYLAAEDYFQKALKANPDLSRIYYDGNPYQPKAPEPAKMAAPFNAQVPQERPKRNWTWLIIVVAVLIVGFAFLRHIHDRNSLLFSDGQLIPADQADSIKQLQLQQADADTLSMDDAISYVKDHYLDDYPNLKIGDAVNNTLSNPNWSAATENRNSYFVAVAGNMLESPNHELVRLVFLLVYQKSGKVITMQSLELNNAQQGPEEIRSFLGQMYPN